MRAKRTKRAAREPDSPDVVTFVRTRLGIDLDEPQAELLHSNARRLILNCSRQWGKSTVAATKAVHRAYTQPECLIVVASPSRRQSAEFVRKSAGMVRRLGIMPRGDGDNEHSLLFPNGSRIVGVPDVEETVRGFSAVSLMLIDEAARVRDEMYRMLRPMLAVGGGALWLMSTPRGRRGFFWDNWELGGPEWLRVSVPATECARIPREFLEEERKQMSPPWFRQEYLCEFVDSGAGVFEREVVEKALDRDVGKLDYSASWE